MKRFLVRACLVLCVVGIPSVVSAQGDTAATAKVAAILAQHPDGGQALADAIAQAVEAEPSLAGSVVEAALTATPAQQTAIGTGLAQAVTYFASSNSPGAKTAQGQIQAAIASAPTAAFTAFNAGGGTTALLLQTDTTTLTTNNCVSPSRPGNGC